MIAEDRHDLGVEQVDKFYEEHPNTALVARIWRGRAPSIPSIRNRKGSKEPKIQMCQRNNDAEEVGKHGFSVEKCLCRHVDQETKEETLCPHYSAERRKPCGYQRQQCLHANCGFARTRRCCTKCQRYSAPCCGYSLMKIRSTPSCLGSMKRSRNNITLALDASHRDADPYRGRGGTRRILEGRRQLHKILAQLREGPVPVNPLREFWKEKTDEMLRLEWKNKVNDVDITPDMDSDTIRNNWQGIGQSHDQGACDIVEADRCGRR